MPADFTVRQAVVVSGAGGLAAGVLLAALAPVVTRAFGAGPAVAADGVLFLRCVGPYLLLACCIALGGVFEGSGGAPVLLRVTLLGTAVQLPLAYGLSVLGLPGICLALGVHGGAVRRARAAPAAPAGSGPQRLLGAGRLIR